MQCITWPAFKSLAKVIQLIYMTAPSPNEGKIITYKVHFCGAVACILQSVPELRMSDKRVARALALSPLCNANCILTAATEVSGNFR